MVSLKNKHEQKGKQTKLKFKQDFGNNDNNIKYNKYRINKL